MMLLSGSSAFHSLYLPLLARHIDLRAAALTADQPAEQFRYWRLWSIPASLLSRVGFAPVTTCFAPDGKPELGRSGALERHRRASVGLHLPRGLHLGEVSNYQLDRRKR